jgi:tRNA dimethylallyltransferase
MARKTLLVVAGPTGIGKTAIAVQLARHFDTEILSADSRQFFREMRIGTAVPTEEQLQSVPHHFIQHKSIQEPYSVGDYERDATARLVELFREHDVIVMAGGSGLYIDAVLYGFDSFPEIDPSIRKQLIQELEHDGLEVLQEELKQKDPEYAKKVDLQNPQRITRALEVYRATGKPYSSFLGRKKTKRPFRHLILGLEAPREVLYQRIDERVDHMMAAGLLEEVKSLKAYEDLNALQTVGYKELFRYLNGELDLEKAVLEIKKNSRRYAKRQGTWFRRNKEIVPVPHDTSPQKIFDLVAEKLKGDEGR